MGDSDIMANKQRKEGMMKKIKYSAPKVVGSSSVHPC